VGTIGFIIVNFNQFISAFSQDSANKTLHGIGRGIEREALRILEEGKLAETKHAIMLGSALTHPNITTDYSETLMEFITPVSYSIDEALGQLRDVQKYTFSQIGEELLWPMSMPCFVNDEEKIAIADYGTSNIGKMKSTYRQGLKNRYGSMMQVIAGIHFNFSFPEAFWQQMKSLEGNQDSLQDYISAKYFALLRNYKRFCWLIPYLYGSSPAICSSFLQNKETTLPFKKSKSGYLYLEHATSLRMSDLGYTNSEQSSLHICYNDLAGYVAGVKEAINLSSEKFAKIGVKVDGKYQQLNANVLQIENELYAPVRPKQVAKSGEKPTDALLERGVEYIEVRALDVNPFVDTGISEEQIRFLDVFLTYCLFADSAELSCDAQNTLEENMDDVVTRGRDPELKLNDNGKQRSISCWGREIFDGLAEVAKVLDKAYSTDRYQEAIAFESAKIDDSALTPSAKILHRVVNERESLTELALSLAKQYKVSSLNRAYSYYDGEYFDKQTSLSIAKTKEIEASDTLNFDEFLEDYFKQ